ncbi:unnamed protein product, partial [Prunus brigantina]
GFTSVVRSLPFPPLGHLFDPQDVPPPQLNCIPIANTQKMLHPVMIFGCEGSGVKTEMNCSFHMMRLKFLGRLNF